MTSKNTPPADTTPENTTVATTYYQTVQEGLDAYYAFQSRRVVENYKKAGYEIHKIGVRPTKNPNVHMMRAIVTVPAKDSTFTIRVNAKELVRQVFPISGEISVYQINERDDVRLLDAVVCVWFAFDSQPMKSTANYENRGQSSYGYDREQRNDYRDERHYDNRDERQNNRRYRR